MYGFIVRDSVAMGKQCAVEKKKSNGDDTDILEDVRRLMSFMFSPLTADDVAAVKLLAVPYVQQQVGAVGVGPVSQLCAGHRHIRHLLIVPVEVQLPHTADNTVT